MMILLTLGMMNPFVMVGVAINIAAEKMLPRPEIVAGLVGLATIITGMAIIWEKPPHQLNDNTGFKFSTEPALMLGQR